MRKNAREAVYKLLFSNLFNDKFDDNFKNFIYEEENLSEEDKAFANEILDAFYANEAEVNEIITNLAKNSKANLHQ